jgi:hypothetical protein
MQKETTFEQTMSAIFVLEARNSGKNWSTVSRSVCLGIEHPCGTCDQILLPVGMLLSEICGLSSVARPLWREDGSAIWSVMTQWSESLRSQNHTLLSHLRLPQHGGPGSRIYISQEQGGPVVPPGTGFGKKPAFIWYDTYLIEKCAVWLKWRAFWYWIKCSVFNNNNKTRAWSQQMPGPGGWGTLIQRVTFWWEWNAVGIYS